METAALILFFILSSLMCLCVCRYSLNCTVKNSGSISKRGVIGSVIVMVIIVGMLYYFLVSIHQCSMAYAAVSIVLSLLLAIMAYHKSGKYPVTKLGRTILVVFAFAISAMVNMGSIAFCRWLFPDVSTARIVDEKYAVSAEHAWPFIDGFKPSGSYFVNDTPDTLFRVVVSYAILGEEVNNHYNVTDTILPMSTAKIACPPNYVCRDILPVMLPTSTRLGKRRTRCSYITTGTELRAFVTGDFRCLGINENIRARSFDITSNPIVWEDPQRIEAMEKVIREVMKNKH